MDKFRFSIILLLFVGIGMNITPATGQEAEQTDPRRELGVELGMSLSTVLASIRHEYRVESIDTVTDFAGAQFYDIVVRDASSHTQYNLQVGQLNGLWAATREAEIAGENQSRREYEDRCGYFRTALGQPAINSVSDDASRCHWGMTTDGKPIGVMTAVIRVLVEEAGADGKEALYRLFTVVYDYPRQNAELALRKL